MPEYFLEMKKVTKLFPGVKALDNVSLRVRRGEVHALVGENGAGKSTLMNVLSGNFPYGTFEGEILINGEIQRFETIADSEAAGISIIFQELALAPQLSVAENIFLGNERQRNGLIEWNRTHKEAAEVLSRLGLRIDTEAIVGDLGVGQQQLIEIAKAISKKAEVLILDEPSAALSEQETEVLLTIIEELRRQGITCIYISHKFDEVFRIADTITVLRDGATVESRSADKYTNDSLIQAMVGRTLTEMYPIRNGSPGETVFIVKGISAIDHNGRQILKDNNFDLRKGEILGFSGLMGSGRTELAMHIIGAMGIRTSGQMVMNGKGVYFKNPNEAINAGISYLSEDRKTSGLNLLMDVKENMTLASLKNYASRGVLNENREIIDSRKFVDDLAIKTPGIETQVMTLSGGNQQKVALAKWMLTSPKILILDEPTRGIDIGAKHEIYKIITKLADLGYSIMMISSELPELLGVCDRIAVMREGHICGIVTKDNFSQETVMSLATQGEEA